MFDLISSVASAAVTSGLLMWLFKEWLSTRLRASIQHEYDKKLAAFKAELQTKQDLAILDIKNAAAREAAFYASAHGSFSEGQKAAMERKLLAIDKLWQSVLQFRSGLPAALIFTDVMTVAEYTANKDDPQFPGLSGPPSEKEILSFKLSPEFETMRPYIGEYLWAVFDCYHSLLLRIVALLRFGKTDADKIQWYNDLRNKRLLSAVLTAEEVTEFDAMQFNKLEWIKQRLEAKMLAASQQVISGESFGADSLKQAAFIQLQLAKNRQAEMPFNTSKI